MEMPGVRPRYVVSTLRFLFVDQLISNLHTSIILGISSLSSKLGKDVCQNTSKFLSATISTKIDIQKIFNLRNVIVTNAIQKWWPLQPLWWPFWQLFSIWSPISKCSNAPITKKIYIQGFLEECDRDQCDFKMAVILGAIFKMAAKMRKISKCSNFSENWYVGFFPHEECDSD